MNYSRSLSLSLYIYVCVCVCVCVCVYVCVCVCVCVCVYIYIYIYIYIYTHEYGRGLLLGHIDMKYLWNLDQNGMKNFAYGPEARISCNRSDFSLYSKHISCLSQRPGG